MNKIIQKVTTILTICVMLAGLYVPTAYAATRSADQQSKAIIRAGESSDKGEDCTLYKANLTGKVVCQTSGTGASVTGYMRTKGVVFSVIRDSKTASNNDTENFDTWVNSTETGTFWAEIISANSNASGYCEVNQHFS